MNLRNVPYEERMAREDHFLFDMDGLLNKDWKVVLKRRHLLVGIICIFFGAWILFQNIVGPYLYQLSEIMPWLYHLINSLPTILVATAIILLGKPLSIALYSLGLTVLFQQITGWLG